ncbi:MAG: site-specific integrase [Proteobacteria bacterium]|nr:site-specific integrase [Pseudomonadota bacterium]MBU4355958.1 site-specific integrase [Pseudomonadota bacterium]MBU4447805.1 site-specific integrase [Pseudomonadota bacterium]MCG2772242.1 site-specific integrase [Desulfobacterales bacterium]
MGSARPRRSETRRRAEAVASQIRERLAKGDFQIGHQKKVPTFGEYARKYLDGYGATNLKYSTNQGYEIILRLHLFPLMDRQLDQITRTEIKDLIYAKLKDGLAPATVTRIKALISSILSHALEDDLISANPASRLGRQIKSKDKKADVNPLTREEAAALLETVAEHYPRYHPFFMCALRTGMRLGELRGLEWGDVDFRDGFIEVRRGHVRGRVTTPKNHKTRRVDMSPQLAKTLKELKTDRKREALTKGWGEVPACVFINEAGQVLDEGNLRRRVFYPALAKAGMRHIRIHDLRHTYASILIQNGESLAYVRDQLGHSSIQITVDIYGHLVPGANRQAVARLDDDVSDTYGRKPGCV